MSSALTLFLKVKKNPKLHHVYNFTLLKEKICLNDTGIMRLSEREI